MFYIYAHIDPSTKKPFYVGKGVKTRAHEVGGRSKAWRNYVESMILPYDIKILHACDDEFEAFILEAKEIHAAIEAGAKLTNKVIPPIKISNHLASFVKYRRKQLGITQREAADRAGVGLRFWRNLEQGKRTLKMDKVNDALWLFGYCLGPIKM